MIHEPTKETLALEQFLETHQPGTELTYHQIAQVTGVKMDLKGKGYLRSAIHRLKLEYICNHGVGITLGSPTNSSTIIAHKVIRIDNSVKQAEKTTKNVHRQFYDHLPYAEQKQVNYLAALFGTIRSYSQSAKRLFKKEPPKLNL